MPNKVTGRTVNDELARSFVTMTANLSRLSASETLIVQGILKDLEIEITNTLNNNPNISSWRKSRFEALLAQTQDTIKANYGQISNQHQTFLTETGEVVSKAAAEIFASIGVPLQSVVVTPEAWAAIARASLVNGAPSSEWWKKQSQNLQDAFLQQMRIGYASGESIQDLVKRVRGTATGKKNNYVINGKTKVYVEFQGGIMNTGTRQAEALVRTSVQQMAADAKMELFKKNADILKGVMWLSTLDARTTPLCRSRDGLLYDLDGRPIGHRESFLGGPPAHWNCRSTLVPVTKSFEELGSTPGVTKTYLEQIGEGTRASMNGQVPDALTFDSWFNQLPERDQISFLGPKKFEIWKKAGLNFADMVDPRGNPLTIEQLANAYGIKIQQSIQTGIPNVPKQMVSAIAVEQQAQMLASQAAEEAAKSAKAAALAELQSFASGQELKQQIYEEFQEELDKQNPEQALAHLQKQFDIEVAAKEKLAKLTKDVLDIVENPQAKNYVQAMEKSIVLEGINKELLPSMQIKVYDKELKKLRKVNKKLLEEFTAEIDNNPILADLAGDWKKELASQGKKLPVWNMQQYKADFQAFVTKLDNDALSKISQDMADAKPIAAEIMSKAWKEANMDLPPGLGQKAAAYKKYHPIYDDLYKFEKEAQQELKEWASKSGHFNAIAGEVMDAETGVVLPSDVLKKAKEKYLIAEQAAKTELQSILDKAGMAEQKAWSNIQAVVANEDSLQKLTILKNEIENIKAQMAAVAEGELKEIAGGHSLEGSILKVGSKQFDLTNAEDVAAFKKYKSMHLSKYKQNIMAGKPPAPLQKEMYEALSETEKQAFDDSLAKALGKKETLPPTSNAVPEPGNLQMSQMEKIGAQKGSNEGGFYRDLKSGTEYYIKFPASEDIARNELLAAKLYEAAGVEVPELTLINDGGRVGIASKIKPGLTNVGAEKLAKAIGAGDNYAVDAWLANWDVVGLSYDNLLLTPAGTAFRVDVGGSLRYRAQGGLKGAAFGKDVIELESLRDPMKNPQSSSVFSKLKKADLEAGVRKVLELSDDKIRALVAEYGPLDKQVAGELADILIARKNYLAKEFPHLAKPSAVAPVIEAGEFVGNAEIQAIKNARINGYAIPADKDKIEDQSILVWFEKDEKGNDFTGLRLKFTDAAQSDIMALVKKTAVLSEQEKELAQEFLDFRKKFRMQWNVNHNQKGIFIDKALADQNWIDLSDAYDALLEKLKKYDKNVAKEVKDLYHQPMKDLKRSLSNSSGKFSPLGLLKGGKFDIMEFGRPELPDLIHKVRPAVSDPDALEFTKKQGTFHFNKLQNGYAVRQEKLLPSDRGGTWGTVYEATTPNGTKIRVWPEEDMGGRALQYQIEVLAPGADKKSVNDALKVVQDGLKLPVEKPTLADREEMYLRMIARHRGDWTLLDQADELRKTGKTADEIAGFLKTEISAKTGKDITKQRGYNPWGNHEAFDSGFLRLFSPTIDTDKEWVKLNKDYLLLHSITGGGDLVETLDAVLNSGGRMITTASKLRYGVPWGGMSPQSDMDSGGADYFFTRLFTKRKALGKTSTLLWEARQLGRLDAIHYDSDLFGRTTDDTVRRRSKHGVADHIEASTGNSNEAIFKGGLSLFDGLKHINCNSQYQAERVFEVLAKHGWTDTWVDGRKLSEVVLVDGKPARK